MDNIGCPWFKGRYKSLDKLGQEPCNTLMEYLLYEVQHDALVRHQENCGKCQELISKSNG